MFRKGDEVHVIFNGLVPSLRTGRVAAVFGDDHYRIENLGKISFEYVFPKTAEGLKAAQAAFRARMLELKEYYQQQIADIDRTLNEHR